MISVYITSFNKSIFISEAIESVLSQTLKPYELIIIDDASTDNSREIIDGYNALLGDNSNQICDLIIKCANDNNLKRDLAKNGMKTLKSYFNPKNITGEISSVMLNN